MACNRAATIRAAEEAADLGLRVIAQAEELDGADPATPSLTAAAVLLAATVRSLLAAAEAQRDAARREEERGAAECAAATPVEAKAERRWRRRTAQKGRKEEVGEVRQGPPIPEGPSK